MPNPVKKPNLFLLGAAKCGTTTLQDALDQHPEIFMTKIKSPTYFCDGFQLIKDPIEYFNSRIQLISAT